jgi:hypothetical protein
MEVSDLSDNEHEEPDEALEKWQRDVMARRTTSGEHIDTHNEEDPDENGACHPTYTHSSGDEDTHSKLHGNTSSQKNQKLKSSKLRNAVHHQRQVTPSISQRSSRSHASFTSCESNTGSLPTIESAKALIAPSMALASSVMASANISPPRKDTPRDRDRDGYGLHLNLSDSLVSTASTTAPTMSTLSSSSASMMMDGMTLAPLSLSTSSTEGMMLPSSGGKEKNESKRHRRQRSHQMKPMPMSMPMRNNQLEPLDGMIKAPVVQISSPSLQSLSSSSSCGSLLSPAPSLTGSSLSPNPLFSSPTPSLTSLSALSPSVSPFKPPAPTPLHKLPALFTESSKSPSINSLDLLSSSSGDYGATQSYPQQQHQTPSHSSGYWVDGIAAHDKVTISEFEN